MNQEVLEQINQRYLKTKRSRDRIQKVINRIEDLKQTKEVKDYLRLLRVLNRINYSKYIDSTDEELLKKSFFKYSPILENVHDIYIYTQTMNKDDEAIDFNDKRAKYHIYMNMENIQDVKSIKKLERKKFEKKHIVIYPDSTFDHIDVTRYFLEQSFEYGQQEAIKKVIRKYKK